MPSLYNRVAGQSVERLAALRDGIFAAAVTLLVLDLHLPVGDAAHFKHDLWHLLLAPAPRLVIFPMSVMTLGIFSVGWQTQLNHFTRAHGNLAWIHIAFLRPLGLVPLSTALLAEFIHHRTRRLPVQHSAARRSASLELELCHSDPSALPRYSRRNSSRGRTTHRDRVSALCRRRRSVFFQHLLRHRRHRAGAGEPRHCAAILLGNLFAAPDNNGSPAGVA
jgi:hypothetical protein